ncbi:hypothetical protein BOTBODRAFT_174482 [Botryobasidium botryosum FD-172 SS1]|uniref:DRBM domain-containing protein n=1 Tax=Botryobasidium botryosum (strain FD-172 SS1) TaxID=930990 RepID=A0A067MSP1_BOTB1|nr:hypothetical protein BOTBODRAFT_174482 [Botryobasidium botryosum FD-172 SS1]
MAEQQGHPLSRLNMYTQTFHPRLEIEWREERFALDFAAGFTLHGRDFIGRGTTRIGAKNAAAERALEYLAQLGQI